MKASNDDIQATKHVTCTPADNLGSHIKLYKLFSKDSVIVFVLGIENFSLTRKSFFDFSQFLCGTINEKFSFPEGKLSNGFINAAKFPGNKNFVYPFF